ncbi:enoyl-CoA hydratase/isomerase family protein [Rossellomorea marisflavi]|uniref:enoyl-CoA hydratase/isomerase family protein n=1 Tax=Rossellomorea marisflavi TaxID=189381 RepID=UPI0020423D5B|nr:enoyl-CoA hydratase/isomerase family protein [Rossellomorea marisflavi]
MGSFIMHTNESGITRFVLNRPEKRNAINFDLIEAFSRCLDECEKGEVKMLLLTGAGTDSFCSGGDLSAFHGLKTEEESYGMLRKMGDVLVRLAFLPIPTLALVNGTAVGGGCEIAAACDLRIAADDVKMGFVQGRLGISTGWGGGTLLHERISSPRAMELLMTGTIKSAETLYDYGFINALVSSAHRLEDHPIVTSMEEKSIGTLKAYKQQLLDRWDKAVLMENIEREIRRCSKLWASDDHHQAVERFLNKK